MSDELADRIATAVNSFKENFTATDGSSVVPKEKDAEALDEDDLEPRVGQGQQAGSGQELR
jgi:F-type H+-transporting ATPase subunit alpha